MENQKKKKKKNFFFFVKLGSFCLELGKNILFGIGNGAEFRPQNLVIESPVSLTIAIYISVMQHLAPL